MEGVDDFFEIISEKYSNRIVDVVEVKPDPFRFVSYELPAELKKRISKLGIRELFEHQVKAIEALKKGKNICLVSSTASGKSLVFAIPVLNNFIQDNYSTSILIYPAKSLAQDQIKNFLELIPEARPAVYDGDTPQSIRRFIRENSKLIATNPEMLHFGILPNHRLWANFFRNLKIIVVDEMHVYRGAFGSNAAFVFRRLLRVASLYGAKPQIIMTSATVGNPKEVAEKLFGVDFELIESKKISPVRKRFVFWNPPFDAVRGKRASPNRDAVSLFADAVEAQLRTIVFSKSKQTAELIAKDAKERVSSEVKKKIAVYRAGLMPERRRKIEKMLFEGEILGVSTTPALELGIDIGDLSVAIINRFPGTVSSFFQQAGRVGRKKSSLVFFIAGEDPLDQYYVLHPLELMVQNKENAIVDLTNEYISERHLLSAAYEHPLKESDFVNFFEEEHKELSRLLVHKGMLMHRKGRFFILPGKSRPHDSISLRTASPDFYTIIDIDSGEMIGTMESSLAFFYLHPGAVYLHESSTYVVKDLDIENKVAKVSLNDEVPYYTITLEDTQVEVLKETTFKKFGKFQVCYGKLRVTNHIIGFHKKHVLTDELLGFTPLCLPPIEFVTHGFWFELSDESQKELGLDEGSLAGGIHGIEHAHIALLPFFAGCDRWDIGGLSTVFHPDTQKTTIFIYDGYEGGIGFSERGFEFFDEHVFKTLETIESCPCEKGCPGCIVSPKCGNNNEPLDKGAAIRILKYHLY